MLQLSVSRLVRNEIIGSSFAAPLWGIDHMVLAALFISLFTQQSDTAIIDGVVRTAGTDVPIAGAEVNALPTTPGVQTQAITDAEGRFRLTVKPLLFVQRGENFRKRDFEIRALCP